MHTEKIKQQIKALEKQLPGRNGKAFHALKGKILGLKKKLKDLESKQHFNNWLAM